MASSSSSSTMSPTITQEEFYAFHHVDRKLFYRLVFNLSHEPAEAMQVAAFWLWFERTNMAHYVSTILQLPDTVFEVVFEETLLCLRVAETDDSSVYLNDVPFVQSIVGKHREGVNLKFFHDNRITLLSGVGNIIQEVCLRAFQDLIEILKATDDYNEYPPPSTAAGVGGGPISRETGGSSRGVGGGIGGFRPAQQPPLSPVVYEQNFVDNQEGVGYPTLIRVGDFAVPLKGEYNVSNYNFSQRGGIGSSKNVPNVPIVKPFTDKHAAAEAQSQALERDLVEIIAKLRLGESSWHQVADERPIHLPSDRTIFLTFSKGYPIYEFELREFLTRYTCIK